MAKLIKEIKLQDGDWYKLYENGKGYKSVWTTCDGQLDNEQTHIHIQAAMNSRQHRYFVKIDSYEQ